MTKATQFGFQKNIDVVELSDAFRRHARFDDAEAVRDLVHEARRFTAFSTWYDPAETFRHRDLTDSMRHSISRMAALAVRLGADEIELPVSGDPRNPVAGFIQRKVLGLDSLPVKVSLQKGEYNKDFSLMGRIDRRIKTPIDQGLRGMADINSNLKMKW